MFAVCSIQLEAQSAAVGKRVDAGELQMDFPGIYFRHNSTEYAPMPYRVDSCLRYLIQHYDDIRSFVMWRDSSESEKLSADRISKIEADLQALKFHKTFRTRSMGNAQKVSYYTIRQCNSVAEADRLLSLNSVFEIAKSRLHTQPGLRKFCWHCVFAFRACQTNRLFYVRLFR